MRAFDRNFVDFKGDVGAVNSADKTFAYTVSSEKFTVKVNSGTKITDAGLTKAFSDLKEG